MTHLHAVPYPTIRRLACTTFFDTIECSQDKSVVAVATNGDAQCAYGHRWTDQADAYGRRPAITPDRPPVK